jgi:hypothetical protein
MRGVKLIREMPSLTDRFGKPLICAERPGSSVQSFRGATVRWRARNPVRLSPDYPHHPSNVPCPIPRWTATGASVGYLPVARGLPRSIGGSASTTSLSTPAQASLALRPAGLLSRPRRPLSQGSSPASYPTKLLVSYQSYRLLSGWILPPLVLRAFGAHYGFRARGQEPAPRNDALNVIYSGVAALSSAPSRFVLAS